jgi:glycosyltransferase involved in cell wall biosynthesis
MDSFQNKNSESFYKWIFRKTDHLDQVVFIFISKLNTQNARNFQLFDASDNVRIVYLNGIKFRFTDLFLLNLFTFMINLFKNRIKNYRVLHLFSTPGFSSKQKQVLHLDDPLYSKIELENLKKWELNQKQTNGQSILICTNQYTKNWFDAELKFSNIFIIEQGFKEVVPVRFLPKSKFTCVYSSPYIHLANDKHGNHSTWGSELLINQIIPKLNLIDPDIEIHLIGELGKDAHHQLRQFRNVFLHGRVSFERNMQILSSCSIGLYPRSYDHKRSILKIFSYIGAGLPVVSFDLEDTRVIKDNNLGVSVNTVSEFIEAIILLKKNPHILQNLKLNIEKFRTPYTWENLSRKMSDLLN